LRTAVRDAASGILVPGHDPVDYADVLESLLRDPARRRRLARGALTHAAGFGWSATAAGVLASYRDALDEREVAALGAAAAGGGATGMLHGVVGH
jgi:D-inositol-3-phosphate glycosyltransferase